MQNSTKSARRKEAIRTTVLCGAVLIVAAIVTIWAQRTFWPEGILARMMPYMALLYILLLPALGISLRAKLRRIDEEEERKHEASDD
ncbi:hypothetical protein [uncultured Oscillibacter sp.]|uniref:hypothetical protein n=1 Tax=uncultured Oscillibacter sp. TaxID=876091 RepID=UPI0025F8AED2|nr:hypothetical protein [uncultured Oscillibacter sp.]